MRNFILIILLFTSCTSLGQKFIATPLNCGTQNKKAQEYYNYGNDGIKSNYLKLSIKFFKTAVELDPAFCDAWDNLSFCYRRLGFYDDAFKAGFRSVLIDSTNPVAWANCGYASFLKNDIANALTSFDYMQSIIPNNPEGYYGKCIVLYSIDSIPEARMNIIKAEQIYRDSKIQIGSEVYLLKGLIEYRSGNKKEAQVIFKNIYHTYRHNAEVNYFLGMSMLENRDDLKKARRYIDIAKSLGYTIKKEEINSK